MLTPLVISYLVNTLYALLRIMLFGAFSALAWWIIDRLTPIPMNEHMKEGLLGAWIAFAALLIALALILRL